MFAIKSKHALFYVLTFIFCSAIIYLSLTAPLQKRGLIMRYALYDVYKATIGRYLYEIETLPSEWRYYSRRQKIIFIVSVIVLFMLVGCIDY